MKSKKIISLAVFVIITIVIQVISTYINIAGFPITLSLVPIIVGSAIYGISFGCLLGLIFGIIVSITVLIGLDPLGLTMFLIHPFITISICLIKGILSGLVASLTYSLIKNKKLAIIISSLTATIVNTLSFLLVLLFFFNNSFSSVISTLLSINFLIEILVNTLLAPSLLPIIKRKIIN